MTKSDPNEHVVRYYVIQDPAISTLPLFFFEAPEVARRLVETIAHVFDHNAVAEELGFHTHDVTHEKLEALGYKSDLWALYIERAQYPWSAVAKFYCGDRACLQRLAQAMTEHDESVHGQITRYARIRFIYERGQVASDFSDVPYLNVSESDWV